MMMYRNNFVLAVLVNSQVLREMPGNGTPQVYMPFGTEYVIRLKNNNNLRAVASVKIDGTLAGQVVVPANESLDLERFLVDGNLNSGNRFKFVRLSDSRVQDPTSSDSGIVEVDFELERVHFIGYLHVEPQPIWHDPMREIRIGSSGRGSSAGLVSDHVSWTNQATYTCSNNATQLNCCQGFVDEQKGATVPGSVSNQKFQSTWIDTDPMTRQTLRLKIVPSSNQSQPVTVANTRWIYCPACRGKCKNAAKFCQYCGANLRKLLV